jgi:alpha-galactosidase
VACKTPLGHIKDAGLSAGVWVAPFMVGSRSQHHRRASRLRFCAIENAGAGCRMAELRRQRHSFAHRRGNSVLDTTNPAAFEYLRLVFALLRGWAVDVFRPDFMDWGLRDATQYRCHSARDGLQHTARARHDP